MGSVYLAEDTELRRQVALKIPKFAQQEPSELLERFYREARSAATLNHTNICQVYDIGEHEGTRYISMAYIGGPSLSKLVGSPKLHSERTIAKLIRKIAVGLAQAHGKGILHPEDLTWSAHFADKTGIYCHRLRQINVRRFCDQR